MPLAMVQQAAADEGLMFPLSLAAEGSCTIGGNLSTNAGGHAVLRFGNTRDLVLGIEVVLADGRIWDGLRGLRKDNTGYDLKQLFIGAEGTLGVVTAAVLKLYPAPRTRVTALAALPDVADGDSPALRPSAGARRPDHRLRADVRLFARAVAQASPDAARSVPRHVRGTRCCRSTTARSIRRLPAQLERALRARRSNRASCRTRRSRSRASRRARCGRCARTSRKRSGATARTSSTTSRFRSPSIARFLDEAARSARSGAARACGSSRSATWATATFTTTSPAPEGVAARGVPCAHGAREPDRPRPRRRAWRQHQRRARHRPAEARRARPLQERRRARPDAHGQGRARPVGHLQSRQDLPAGAMTKILLWIVVIVGRAARAAAAECRQGEAARRRRGRRRRRRRPNR